MRVDAVLAQRAIQARADGAGFIAGGDDDAYSAGLRAGLCGKRRQAAQRTRIAPQQHSDTRGQQNVQENEWHRHFCSQPGGRAHESIMSRRSTTSPVSEALHRSAGPQPPWMNT
jgi:hypothetical protein